MTYKKHPGHILLHEFLQPACITFDEFDHEAGWPAGQCAQFVAGGVKITSQVAYDLARVLGTSPLVWVVLQADYDRGLN